MTAYGSDRLVVGQVTAVRGPRAQYVERLATPRAGAAPPDGRHGLDCAVYADGTSPPAGVTFRVRAGRQAGTHERADDRRTAEQRRRRSCRARCKPSATCSRPRSRAAWPRSWSRCACGRARSTLQRLRRLRRQAACTVGERRRLIAVATWRVAPYVQLDAVRAALALDGVGHPPGLPPRHDAVRRSGRGQRSTTTTGPGEPGPA